MKKKTHTYTKKECTVLVNTIHFKNARELLQNCLADVKAVTSELNVKGKLWKLTHLKISSVTSAPLGLSDRAVVCRPEKKKKSSGPTLQMDSSTSSCSRCNLRDRDRTHVNHPIQCI